MEEGIKEVTGGGEPYRVTFSIICAVKYVATVFANSLFHLLSKIKQNPTNWRNPNSRNF